MDKKDEIIELFTIIPRGYPSFEIFHIDDCNIFFSKELNRLCMSEGYGYDLEIDGDKNLDDYKNKSDLVVREFEIQKHRYNRHAKLYDLIFITLDLKRIKEIEPFLKKLYPIAKNGAKVIFITSLDYDLYSLEERLNDLNYVAINKIENTLTNHQILGAQKMHGWGN